MAGPIQTAIGQMLGSALGLVGASRKIYEDNEGQAAQEKGSEGAKKEEAKKSDQKAIAKALKIAQQNKIDSPKQIYLSEDETPIATSEELASVLSSQSLGNALSSKKRARDKVRERKAMLAKRKLAANK